MAAYAELPGRLLACRSPAEFWAEYMRFGQRLLAGFLPDATASRDRHRAKRSRPRRRA
jgi:hypothetical protein